MKRIQRMIWLALTGGLVFVTMDLALAQSTENVVRCQSLEDVKKARESGALFFEFRGRYWVKVGADYKGSFKDLETARKVLRQYGEQLPASELAPSATQAVPATPSASSPGQAPEASGLVYFYPELVLYPFVQLTPKGTQQLLIPGGEPVETTQVMIHPEPFQFSEISFGVIDPTLIGRLLLAEQKRLQELGIDPPPVTSQPGGNRYFAVTGSISPREAITVPSGSLTCWVGAAAVGNDGSVLWQAYGPVDAQNRFKCIEKLTPTTIPPQFLLIFTLGKGQLATNLRPKPDLPSLDATPYPYHVLASATLKMDANWLPPMEEMMREEYMKLQEAMKRGQPVTPGARSSSQNPKSPR
ncbi:MAG TPA: hypothetical protein PLH79_14060 [bacterium]|nr:hypothetical protein [bacterium]